MGWADHSSRVVIPNVVCECDREASILRRPWQVIGCRAVEGGRIWSVVNMTVYRGTWFSNVSCEPPCNGTRMHARQYTASSVAHVPQGH